MDSARLRRGAFVVGGALALLVIWLVLRPDLAGPQWRNGSALEAWLGMEALTAAVIGCVAPTRRAAGLVVDVGRALQLVHLAVLGEHSDDTLWGLGLFLMVGLAVVAVVLAVLAHALVGMVRRRIGARERG